MRFSLPILTLSSAIILCLFLTGDVQASSSTTECDVSNHKAPTTYPKTDIVIAPTAANDAQIAATETVAILPQGMRHYVNQSILDTDELRIDIRLQFTRLVSNIFGRLGIPCFGGYCQAILAAGEKPESDVDGNNTAFFARRAEAIGSIYHPHGMTEESATTDCNLETVTVPGHEDLKIISHGMGTDAGFYRVTLPKFDDWEEKVENRQTSDNLSIGGVLFDQDQRVPDMDLSCQAFNEAYYPEGVGPCAQP